jgi:SAM-dependent methyltransferase
MESSDKVTRYNEALFEEVWSRMPFFPPESLPWWPEIEVLTDAAPQRIEIGPGVFPRFPVAGTHVVELSSAALEVLAARGAIAHRGLLEQQNFADGSIDLVGIFEVLEHVPDDEGLLRELARITRAGGRLMLSVPLGMKYFCSYDTFVGHVRRYEPEELRGKVERAGYVLERFEVRMSSPNESSARVIIWLCRHAPRFSIWLMRYVMLPLGKLMRIKWQDASRWDVATRNMANCSAIFLRVDKRLPGFNGPDPRPAGPRLVPES